MRGRNARKWHEILKNPWGRGRVVLGQEPILASIVNIDNTSWQNVKKLHLKEN